MITEFLIWGSFFLGDPSLYWADKNLTSAALFPSAVIQLLRSNKQMKFALYNFSENLC